MALPAADNGTFAPVVPRARNKALRVAAIGAAVILACAALVALVAQGGRGGSEARLGFIQQYSS